jgi:hypothetical protein
MVSIYFFCVSERGTMNLFFDGTGMVLRKKSFIDGEIVFSGDEFSGGAVSRDLIMYLISSGLMEYPLLFNICSSSINFFARLTAFCLPWRNSLLPLIEAPIPRASSITFRFLSSLP